MFGGAVLQRYIEERGQENPLPAPERVFRDRLDPLNITDNHLLRYYRFPRNVILDLCRELEPRLGRPTARSCALPIHTQVLIGLRFLASGSFQHVLGDVAGTSQTSCSRVLANFCEGIVEMAPQSFNFPLQDPQEMARIKTEFLEIANFPNVIGAIDCTHIEIKSPTQDEANYVNRHGRHSINVQAVCNANLALLNVCVEWPGATHDSFIWRHSQLKRELNRGVVQNGWLLGDSGYPLEQHLMTPVRNPIGAAQERYNEHHSATRSVVERCFGLLKSRFRSIDSSGGTLLYAPQKARNIIVAACVLHNWCIQRNIDLHEPQLEIPPHNHMDPNEQYHDAGAVVIRDNLILRFA